MPRPLTTIPEPESYEFVVMPLFPHDPRYAHSARTYRLSLWSHRLWFKGRERAIFFFPPGSLYDVRALRNTYRYKDVTKEWRAMLAHRDEIQEVVDDAIIRNIDRDRLRALAKSHGIEVLRRGHYQISNDLLALVGLPAVNVAEAA